MCFSDQASRHLEPKVTPKCFDHLNVLVYKTLWFQAVSKILEAL